MNSKAIQAIRYYTNHPVEFVEDIIRAKPDAKQRDILNSVAKYPMTSVRSGHGVGKSAVESWLIIWFLLTRPYPKIPCTAPTQHQLWDILWAEVSKWMRHNPALAKELVWTKEKVYMKGCPEEWFAVGRTASGPDALQGFHAEHILYIIDEASGVKDEIFEPILGSLSTEGAKLVMCGNPTRLTGFFYNSHHKNREQFHTIHIDGRDSGRTDQRFIDSVIGMFGEDSDVFRVRVAGEFPLQENDVFIPLSLAEATTKSGAPASAPKTLAIGVDVARYGDDETVIAVNQAGSISLPITRRGQNLMATVADIVTTYRKLLIQNPSYHGKVSVNIDDTGLGGGVTDRLGEVRIEQRLWNMEIRPVNFAAKVPDEKAAQWFANISTYMWYLVREGLRRQEICLENDSPLLSQLSTRKYTMNSSGKIVLESKDDMKKRGLSSPDRADAAALSCYLKKTFDITGLIT